MPKKQPKTKSPNAESASGTGEKSLLDLIAEHDAKVRKAAAERAKAKKRYARGKWPMKCDAMGVNPDQCEEAEEKMRKAGVNVQYDRKTGQAIIESEGQYKKMRRIAGLRHYGSFTE